MDDLRQWSEPRKWNPDLRINGLSSTLRDYWQWGYWDILVNTNRPVFAEFVVASLLGATNRLRREWEEFDILYKEKKIEIKSSAYLQSWPQKEYSKIIFDIAQRKRWDYEKGEWGNKIKRWADCYVFCLYTEKESKDLDFVLDLSRWNFYLAMTDDIDKHFGGQKKAGYNALNSLWEGPIMIDNLKEKVDQLLKI